MQKTRRGSDLAIRTSQIRRSLFEQTLSDNALSFVDFRFTDEQEEARFIHDSVEYKRLGSSIFLILATVCMLAGYFMGKVALFFTFASVSYSALIVYNYTRGDKGAKVIQILQILSNVVMSSVILFERFGYCGYIVAGNIDCEKFQSQAVIPVQWWFLMILNVMCSYQLGSALVTYLPTHLLFASSTVICILSSVTSYHDDNLLLGGAVLLLDILMLLKVRTLEYNDRLYYINRLQSEKFLAKDEIAKQNDATLVKNALRLTFPENPFHDANTEERLEKCKLALGLPLNSCVAGQSLLPSNLPIPGYGLTLTSRLRSVKLSRFRYHGDPVVVYSIPNLEVLVNDKDLQDLIKIVNDACEQPPLPALTETLGFCWSPCAFVVEAICERHRVSLRDLALELSMHQLQLDWGILRPLALNLTETLKVLHANGVLHRHVSSDTIFLTDKENCCLIPISFLHCFPEVRKKLWGHMTSWMVAPEARQNPQAYTEASEVWSLCIVLWEMLVGPLHGYQEMFTPLAVPPTVPKKVIASILDGLSLDPTVRPTMGELEDTFRLHDSMSRDSTVASLKVFNKMVEEVEEVKELPEELKPPRSQPRSAVGGSALLNRKNQLVSPRALKVSFDHQ